MAKGWGELTFAQEVLTLPYHHDVDILKTIVQPLAERESLQRKGKPFKKIGVRSFSRNLPFLNALSLSNLKVHNGCLKNHHSALT